MSELAAWTLAFCRWCNGSYVGHVIRDSAWLFGSFGIMIVTGISLFAGDPVLFYGTIFFKLKMLMLLAAALNVVVFGLTTGRTMMQWDVLPATPRGAKITGIFSLLLWVAVVACGRGIAYVLPPP